jgi:hypothetical protein
MKNRIILSTALAAFAFAGVASASTGGDGSAGSATMGVTATIVGSISLTVSTDSLGYAVTGSGSSAGTMALGSVQMYGGTVPTNVVRSLTGSTSFTLTTPFDVTALLANSSSSTFVLSAWLTSTDAVNTWTIGTVGLTTTAQPIASTAAYTTVTPYSFALTIPAANTSGSISNTINLGALAN